MKIQIDLDAGNVSNGKQTFPLNSEDAFNMVSQAWLAAGWYTKHVYTFTWLGRPIIQLPEDMLRAQEVLAEIRPDVIIETGVAHGGSLIFYASLCKLFGKGRVIGIDVEIREHNRKAIEEHELFPYITLVEGSSVSEKTISFVRENVQPNETVFVMLDSNHSREHVFKELNCYAPFVTKNSYIVASDGIMKDLVGAPRSEQDWGVNNPFEAAKDFMMGRDDFVQEQPKWKFNESTCLSKNVTYWPGAWLKKC